MDYDRAKELLYRPSPLTGVNLYDHLSQVVKLIIEEQAPDNLDTFEELSRRVKETRILDTEVHLTEEYVPSAQVEGAKKLRSLFGKGEDADLVADEEGGGAAGGLGAAASSVGDDEEGGPPFPNIMELLFNLEQCGVGLPRDEMFAINLALKNLVESTQITGLRFWGKIFGFRKNYIVAEAELMEVEEEEEEEEEAAEEALPAEEEEEEDINPMDRLPVSVYKAPPKIPPEPPGTGVNKKVFFVCNEPGDPWIKLPHVTPEQISVSRKVKKYFTGNLNEELHTYPPYPGNEANYLRAQIARISAGTQISPTGFYTFGEDVEEEEEDLAGGGGPTNYVANAEYEPIPLIDLVDTSMTNWVHHTQHILTQGRTRWWDARKKGADDEDEAEEDDEDAPKEDEEEEVIPETGPPLLSPLSEDTPFDKTQPWSVSTTSSIIKEYAMAIVKSNLWPGAVTYCRGKNFENIYIGWGHKYNQKCYQPVLPDCPAMEYPSDTYELQEMDDPTPEEEEEFRRAKEVEEEEDEEEDEEVEEEDEEDD